MKPCFAHILVCVFALGLASCDHIVTTADIDPAGKLSRDDYLALRKRQDDAVIPPLPPVPPPIPDLAMAPAAHLPGQGRLVSVNVTENVPLRDVLVELAREAKVDLELDPRVQGGIIFSVHNQPFDEVLSHICKLAGCGCSSTALIYTSGWIRSGRQKAPIPASR